MSKPVIGIVSNINKIIKNGFQKPIYDVNKDYVTMIYNNGAIPIILPPIEFENIKEFLENIDALLLIGGVDISRKTYMNCNDQIDERDLYEMKICKYFIENKKPILGICRGMQLINVVQGGTLKNIENTIIHHFIEEDGWINYHEITIKKDTLLSSLLNLKKYTVSSVHHQSIDKLGDNLVVSSVSDDGIIESIESKGDGLILGFQGHIEKCLINYDKYKKIIMYFIKETKKWKKVR